MDINVVLGADRAYHRRPNLAFKGLLLFESYDRQKAAGYYFFKIKAGSRWVRRGKTGYKKKSQHK